MPSAISGSFVRGNYSGRFISFFSNNATHDRSADSSSKLSVLSIRDRSADSSSLAYSTLRDRVSEPRSYGFVQGISLGGPLSSDSNANSGKIMTVGLNKENIQGNPSAPSMRLDYPSSWRFRWVVTPGARSITCLAQQNSTSSISGSFRPSMTVKSNPSIGLNYDISASAPNGNGWQTIGPINFTVTSTDQVWIELRNNNYAIPSLNGYLLTPISSSSAYFDNITTT